MVAARGGAVCTLAFDSRRYVGAQIGIHNPQGKKVGKVSHLRNVEYVVVGGEPTAIRALAEHFGVATVGLGAPTPSSYPGGATGG